MDNYTETVIPVEIASGTLSFKVETSLTSKVIEDYKFIKDVADGDVAWDTVAVNSAEGTGNYFPDTRVYVSFGFGPKRCLEDQTITSNPRGPVTGPQPRKPHKPHKPHIKFTLTEVFVQERNQKIKEGISNSSIRQSTIKLSNDSRREAHLEHCAKLAQILVDNKTRFPKKPLRPTHLRSDFYTDFFKLESPLHHPKAKRVFDLYVEYNK